MADQIHRASAAFRIPTGLADDRRLETRISTSEIRGWGEVGAIMRARHDDATQPRREKSRQAVSYTREE